MFHTEIRKINNNQYIIRYLQQPSQLPVTCGQFIHLLKINELFRQTVNQSIINVPLGAFFFESRVLNNQEHSNQPFFWVAISTKFLNPISKPGPFVKYFTGKSPIVVFPSLNQNTLLVVPDGKYDLIENIQQNIVHLKQFCKLGSSLTIDDFWKEIALTATDFKGNYWLKTHGHGVNYLHFRVQPNIDLFSLAILKEVANCNQFYREQFSKDKF